MADEKREDIVETIAKAMFENDQRFMEPPHRKAVFGMETPVPWDYVIGPDCIPIIAQQYRVRARVAVVQVKNFLDGLGSDTDEAAAALEFVSDIFGECLGIVSARETGP